MLFMRTISRNENGYLKILWALTINFIHYSIDKAWRKKKTTINSMNIPFKNQYVKYQPKSQQQIGHTMEMEMKIHRIRMDNDGKRNEKNEKKKKKKKINKHIRFMESKHVVCVHVRMWVWVMSQTIASVQWHLALEKFPTHNGQMAIARKYERQLKRIKKEWITNKKRSAVRYLNSSMCFD